MRPIDRDTGDVRVEIATPLPLSVSAEVMAAFGQRWPGTMIEPSNHAIVLRIPAAQVHKPRKDRAKPVEPVEHVGYVDSEGDGRMSFLMAEDIARDMAEALGPIAQALLAAYDSEADEGVKINYVTFSLMPHVHPVDERIEVIVHRLSGMSPADKAASLVADIRALLDSDDPFTPWVERALQDALRKVGSTVG